MRSLAPPSRRAPPPPPSPRRPARPRPGGVWGTPTPLPPAAPRAAATGSALGLRCRRLAADHGRARGGGAGQPITTFAPPPPPPSSSAAACYRCRRRLRRLLLLLAPPPADGAIEGGGAVKVEGQREADWQGALVGRVHLARVLTRGMRGRRRRGGERVAVQWRPGGVELARRESIGTCRYESRRTPPPAPCSHSPASRDDIAAARIRHRHQHVAL